MPIKNTNEGYAPEVVKIPLTAAASAGSIGSWQNTRGKKVLILTRGIHVKTPSTGAATVDAGIAATAVTNDTLIDGQALNGVAANTVVQTAGTNGALSRIVPAGYYVTFFASADTTGFTGDAYIEIVELDN